MTVATFRAHCARGHDRIDFAGAEGAKAFELHMKAEHGTKGLLPGSYGGERARDWQGRTVTSAAGWSRGEIEKPHPWKAPRAQRGGLEKVRRDALAGKYDVTFAYAGGTYRERVSSLLDVELAS